MKEKTPGENVQKPNARLFCPQTEQCVRFSDEIDLWKVGPPGTDLESEFFEDTDDGDNRQIARLADHAAYCPLCLAALEDEQRLHEQQRRSLRAFLYDAEQQVPSTTENILAALRKQQLSEKVKKTLTDIAEEEAVPGRLLILPSSSQSIPVSYQRRAIKMRLRYAFSIAVAAIVILAAIATLTQFASIRNTNSAAWHTLSTSVQQPVTPHPGAAFVTQNYHTTADWSSVLAQQIDADGHSQIINYDVNTGVASPLIRNCCTQNTEFDGIVHGGGDLMFHTFNSTNTTYYLLSGAVYNVKGHGSNAVFSTDDKHMFIWDANGLQSIDLRSKEAKTILTTDQSKASYHLEFARQVADKEYLYFTSPSNGKKDLTQVNVANGATFKVVSGIPIEAKLWLDIKTLNIYYSIATSSDDYQTVTINSDGTQQPVQSGLFIGWQGTPLTPSVLVKNTKAGTFRIANLGSNNQPDATSQPSFGSGFSTLCDSIQSATNRYACDTGLALKPDGTVVVYGGIDSNQQYQLRILEMQKQLQERNLIIREDPQQSRLQLIGWDKIVVNG